MSGPAVAGVDYDIVLSAGGTSYGFQIRPGSYQRERADDFAPRIATGNDPSLREGIWDVWAFSGAQDGIDQLTLLDKARVWWADGNVFLSRDQKITLQAVWNDTDLAKTATAPMTVDFSTGSDFVAVGVGTKVRRYNIGANTWTASSTTLGASVVWLHRHGANVFAACGSSTDFYKSTDLDTWTQPAAGEKATCFTSWSKDGAINLVKATGTSFKLSTDNGTTWAAATSVGNPDTNITGLGVAFGLLLIGKEDGLYYFDGTNVVEEIVVRNKKYAGNFKALIYHDGFLYTSVLGEVWKLSFSSGGVANKVTITPEMIGDENKELYGHGIPIWIWSGPTNLYVALDDGESVYPEVLSYTGSGWQQEYRGTSGDTMSAGGYSQLASRTFLNDGATRYRRHPTLRDLPYPDYPATGQFITSDYDGGLPFMYKAFRDVSVEAENLASGKIRVEYSLDKGLTYTLLGDVVVDGKTVLIFPGSDAVGSQNFRQRVTLYRNGATSSPRLRRIATSFLNRPTPIYAFSVDLKLSGAGQITRDDQLELETTDTRLSFLEGAEASISPATLQDMHGKEYSVYLTKTRLKYLPEKPMTQGGQTPPLEAWVTVTLIQVLTAGRWDYIYWDSFTWS